MIPDLARAGTRGRVRPQGAGRQGADSVLASKSAGTQFFPADESSLLDPIVDEMRLLSHQVVSAVVNRLKDVVVGKIGDE